MESHTGIPTVPGSSFTLQHFSAALCGPARHWVKESRASPSWSSSEGVGREVGGRKGRAQTVSRSQDVLTAHPQLRSPHLLAALPPVQPAVSPSSSPEGLPTTQAGWFGPRVLSWPAALPGPSFVLWEGSWPPSPGDCSGASPHGPPCSPFSPFGSPRLSSSQLTPVTSDSSSEYLLNSTL